MSKSIANNKKDKLKKIVLVGTGITATGIAAYFGWQYYKKSQDDKQKKPSSFAPPQDPIPEYKPSGTNNNSTYTPPYTQPYQNNNSGSGKGNSNTSDGGGNSNITDAINTVYNSIPKTKKEFPLKRGSKGIHVRQLQESLIATHGASILPRYGADGDFGSELGAALKKLKYPSTISESLYYVITSTGGTKSNTNQYGSNPNSIARQFLLALNLHNYNKTMEILKVLKSKDDYVSASTEFKNYRVNGGVRQTLVNACLNAFVDKTQKQSIRFEFLRMGLKFNGTQWSLDGIGNEQIITTRQTQVWLDGFNSTQVPCNMILGRAITARLDYTLFEKGGKHFLVKTKDIQRIK